MESSFPRGGVLPKKSSFSSSASGAATAAVRDNKKKPIEFGPKVSRRLKKEKLNRKQREKKQIAKNSLNGNDNVGGGGGGKGGEGKAGDNSDSDSDDDDDDAGLNVATKQLAKANLLTNKSISLGMKLMGVIIVVDTTFLLVLLPGGIVGKVLVSRISNAYIELLSNAMQKDDVVNNDADATNTTDIPYKMLTQLYKIGQLVCVKLIEKSELATGSHNNIQLSMMPADLNDQFIQHNQLKKNLFIWVCISSCEDHGYICETGIKQLRAFIPRNNSTTTTTDELQLLDVGSQLCCKIVNVQLAKSASIATLKQQPANKLELKKFLNINWLLPMVLVKFKINRILKNGLQGTIKFDKHDDQNKSNKNEKLIGVVNEHNLLNIFDKPSDVDLYKIGQILMARILYVMPITKIIYLTLNCGGGGGGDGKDDDDNQSKHRLKDGIIIENAIVLRHTSNGIMVKLNDKSKGIIAYKQLRSPVNISNFDKDEILLKYYQNSVHRVRVLHYNVIDRYYLCSIQESVLKEKYYQMDDVNVGDFVKAKICRLLDDKGYFITVGHIQGYLQYSCIAAKYRQQQQPQSTMNKIKIDELLAVRILKKTDNRVFVTNQREFMQKSYKIPLALKDLQKKEKYYGRIVCEFPRAYVIDLAHDLCGLLFKKDLKPTGGKAQDGDDDDDDLKFKIGDVKQFEIKRFGIGKAKEKFVLKLINPNDQAATVAVAAAATAGATVAATTTTTTTDKKIPIKKEKITKPPTIDDDKKLEKPKIESNQKNNDNNNKKFIDFHIEKLTKEGLFFSSSSKQNGFIPNKFLSDYPDLVDAVKKSIENFQIEQSQLIRCIDDGDGDDDDDGGAATAAFDNSTTASADADKQNKKNYCLNANTENFQSFSQLKIGQLLCGNIENITNQLVEICIVLLVDDADGHNDAVAKKQHRKPQKAKNVVVKNKDKESMKLKSIKIKLHINNLFDRYILNNKHIQFNINLVYGQKLYLKIMGKNTEQKYLHFSGKLSDVWNCDFTASATFLNNYFTEIHKLEMDTREDCQQQQQKKKKKISAGKEPSGIDVLSKLRKYKIGDLIDGNDISITNWNNETNTISIKCNGISGLITRGSHSFKPCTEQLTNWKTIKFEQALIIWIDYGRELIYLTTRKNIIERYCGRPNLPIDDANDETTKITNDDDDDRSSSTPHSVKERQPPPMKQLMNARGLKCDVLLIHDDFTITLPRKLITTEFVFIPRRLHLNDFDGTILRSDFVEGDLANVTVIKTDGHHLIGIYDRVFKTITHAISERTHDETTMRSTMKIELGKRKTIVDGDGDKRNKKGAELDSIKVKRKKLINDGGDEDDEGGDGDDDDNDDDQGGDDDSMEVDNESVSEHDHDKPDSDENEDSDSGDDDDDPDDAEQSEDGDDDSNDGDDGVEGDSDDDNDGDSDDWEDAEGGDEEDDDDNEEEDDDDDDEEDDDDDDQDKEDDEDDDDDDDDDEGEGDVPPHLHNSIGLDQQLDGAVDIHQTKTNNNKKLLGVDNFWNIHNNKDQNISKPSSSSDEEEADNDNDDADDIEKNKILLEKSRKFGLNAKERFQEVRKKEYEIEKLEKQLLESDVTAHPKTADHFDRLLLNEPNNSIIWIKYMAFHLQYNELDKTRTIGQKALKTISYLCTDELLNIWVALLNLELRYGGDAFNGCLINALQRNDPYRIYMATIRMHIDVGDKLKELNGLLDVVQKKFRSNAEMWSMVATAYFDVGQMEKAKQMLTKGLKSIPEKEHINLIIKFANLNHKYNELETAHALFEQILIAYPKRVDCWSQYIDMYIKSNEIESARQILDRATAQKIPLKKMRILFKKYVEFEERFGGDATKADKIEEIKLRAANLINKVIN